MSAISPKLVDFARAAAAVYSRTTPDGWSLLNDAAGAPLVASVEQARHGFYAAAYLTTDKQVIIAYEGTAAPRPFGPSGFLYGVRTFSADCLLLFGRQPRVLKDATHFADKVIAVAEAQHHIPRESIYVAGHSLGGVEAGVASMANQKGFLRGVTFGSPAVNVNRKTNPGLLEYAFELDPIANFEPESSFQVLPAPSAISHIGKVTLIETKFKMPSYLSDVSRSILKDINSSRLSFMQPVVRSVQNIAKLVVLKMNHVRPHAIGSYVQFFSEVNAESRPSGRPVFASSLRMSMAASV